MILVHYTQTDIERAARVYPSTRAAAQALGMSPNSFSRLCRRYGVETPKARKERKQKRGPAAL